MSCVGSEARAVDRIRIDSIEPSVVDRGGEFVVRGGNFSCHGESNTLQTRVRLQRRRSTLDLDAPGHYLRLSVILNDELKAHVPTEIVPGEYAVFVVTFSASERLLCRSNAVRLTVRQPAPPAVSADPNQVMKNPCGRLAAEDAAAALRLRLPGTDEPAKPTCPYPMKLIQLDVNGRTTIYALTPIYLRGVTLEDQDMVIALMRAESSGGPGPHRYFVERLMKVELRTGALTMVRVPDVESGTYKVAALYRFVQGRSLSDLRDDPFRASRAARPLFVMGSNVVDLAVTNPGRR
jgi:hypothetical protein